MQAFELAQLISPKNAGNSSYLEFLRAPDLSMGPYILPAGGTDPQPALSLSKDPRTPRTRSITWSTGWRRSGLGSKTVM